MSLVTIGSMEEFFHPTYNLARERYHIASFYCMGKTVLDIACNGGYGTGLLSDVAVGVKGVDISPDCVEYANDHWKGNNNSFEVGNVLTFPVEGLYDVVVSLETIEHINASFDVSVLSLKKHLKSGGRLIISFPENEQAEPNLNHVHTRINSLDMAHSIDLCGFQIENVIRQGDVGIQGIGYSQTIIIAKRKN